MNAHKFESQNHEAFKRPNFFLSLCHVQCSECSNLKLLTTAGSVIAIVSIIVHLIRVNSVTSEIKSSRNVLELFEEIDNLVVTGPRPNPGSKLQNGLLERLVEERFLDTIKKIYSTDMDANTRSFLITKLRLKMSELGSGMDPANKQKLEQMLRNPIVFRSDDSNNDEKTLDLVVNKDDQDDTTDIEDNNPKLTDRFTASVSAVYLVMIIVLGFVTVSFMFCVAVTCIVKKGK